MRQFTLLCDVTSENLIYEHLAGARRSRVWRSCNTRGRKIQGGMGEREVFPITLVHVPCTVGRNTLACEIEIDLQEA